jgi:hypothetical protein
MSALRDCPHCGCKNLVGRERCIECAEPMELVTTTPQGLSVTDIAVVNASPDTIQKNRRNMVDEVTRLIAATTLAHTEFPQEGDLPRLAPVPYNHLGHQVLLDYDRLAAILWSGVYEIKEKVEKSSWRYLAPLLGFLTAGVFFILGGYALSQGANGSLLLFILGMWAGGAVYAALRPKTEQIAADVRARNIRLLLEGDDPPSVERFKTTRIGGKRLAEWGDGSLDKGAYPVLIMTNDKAPFPGFGRHQSRQLFVCRPEDEAKPPGLSYETLNQTVSEALVRMAKNCGLSDVSSGYVVLIDGSTLYKNSPWLRKEDGLTERDGSPPLFIPQQPIERIQSTDERASVRVYSCIQAFVPEYLMCVTFFVRTFLAGNSAACQVNVCTLGPPSSDWDYIRRRLRAYDREQSKSQGKSDTSRPAAANMTALGSYLQAVGNNLENTPAAFKSKTHKSSILKMDAFDEEALKYEKEQAERIAKNSEFWPGLYTGLDNWRERHSLTFTNDFFGNTESRAVLQTLYDRICRSALNQLKELGFAISDYQDESGKLSINTDSIQQLVVGEKVYMDRKPNQAAEGAAANTSTPAAATGTTT